MSERLDYPNRQVLGLDPPWVEGTGGGEQVEVQPVEQTDLDVMTKEELLAYAQRLGVKPANNAMSKDELRAGVDAKLAEG
jgi:hypothetical protein